MRVGVIGTLKPRHSSQGHAVAEGLRTAGYDVVAASYARTRVGRFEDIVRTLLTRGPSLDALIIQVYTGMSFVVEDVASWIGRRSRTRLILHLHGGDMPSFTRRYPNWTRRALERADAIVTPSSFLGREMGRIGLHAHVIPNLIDHAAHPWRERRSLRPKLLWMRAFHAAYNPLLAVRTIAEVRKEVPGATLLMAGADLGLAGETERLAESLGVGDAVLLPGFLEGPAKSAAFDSHDILLNTNQIDNTPASVLEAMAGGLVVVAADAGGIRDLVSHEETGLVVPPDDARAMAGAVIRALGNPQMAAALARNARVFSAGSTWERVEPLWRDVIESAA